MHKVIPAALSILAVSILTPLNIFAAQEVQMEAANHLALPVRQILAGVSQQQWRFLVQQGAYSILNIRYASNSPAADAACRMLGERLIHQGFTEENIITGKPDFQDVLVLGLLDAAKDLQRERNRDALSALKNLQSLVPPELFGRIDFDHAEGKIDSGAVAELTKQVVSKINRENAGKFARAREISKDLFVSKELQLAFESIQKHVDFFAQTAPISAEPRVPSLPAELRPRRSALAAAKLYRMQEAVGIQPSARVVRRLMRQYDLWAEMAQRNDVQIQNEVTKASIKKFFENGAGIFPPLAELAAHQDRILKINAQDISKAKSFAKMSAAMTAAAAAIALVSQPYGLAALCVGIGTLLLGLSLTGLVSFRDLIPVIWRNVGDPARKVGGDNDTQPSPGISEING